MKRACLPRLSHHCKNGNHLVDWLASSSSSVDDNDDDSSNFIRSNQSKNKLEKEQC